MDDEYLKYIILLEKALADQYARTKELPGFEALRAVLEFMEVHSAEHAKSIELTALKQKRPMLNEKIILDFQNNLTGTVFKKVHGERDMATVLEILADAEHSLSDLYRTIVSHLEHMAEYYSAIAGEIRLIAGQEDNHRDLLLKDRERIIKRKG